MTLRDNIGENIVEIYLVIIVSRLQTELTTK